MHYVYEGLTADGDSAYVGCTTNVERRVREHRTSALWFMGVASWVTLAEFDRRWDAERFEWMTIGERRPLYNVRGNKTGSDTVWANVMAAPPNPHIPRTPLVDAVRRHFDDLPERA